MSNPKVGIPKTVWVLGFVSLLMDISSEMIHALLPLFMAGTLGASAVWIGLVEGVGEGAALITKVFSGVIADRFGHKKWLVFIGYFLGVISKPVFALADVITVVLGARLFDRIGKGMRGAPRDAIVAEVTDESNRGAAYGLRQSLDAAGAFLGPLLATLLLLLWTQDLQASCGWSGSETDQLERNPKRHDAGIQATRFDRHTIFARSVFQCLHHFESRQRGYPTSMDSDGHGAHEYLFFLFELSVRETCRFDES